MSLYYPKPNRPDASGEAADAAAEMADADPVMANADPAMADAAGDAEAQETGILQVEAPHWSAYVSIFDNENQLVESDYAVAKGEESGAGYAAEFRLPAGIYQVETSLGGQTARNLVPVRANYTTPLFLDDTARRSPLLLECSSPLAGAASSREKHAAAAEEWSHTPTWIESPGGDSRLFLFVRTLEEKPDPAFAAGLKLLDAEGHPVTDFSEGVRHNAKQGWSAFTADLPAGAYILRRGGQKPSLRFQPLFLAAGWDTQVFLMAEHYPRLHSMTLNMTPFGTGFRADDERALAATVLLESLRGGQNENLLMAEQLTWLLSGELENPWLNIVAAHALHASLQEQSRQDRDVEEDNRRRELLNQVLSALAPLEEHPDVGALLLAVHPDADSDAPRAFWSPPLLRRSLQLLTHHATAVTQTIPDGCLTDLVLDALIVNSPWTAWHTLDRLPLVNPAGESSAGHGRTQLKTLAASRDVSETITRFTNALARGTSPAAPVFYQAITPRESDRAVALVLPAILTEAGTGIGSGSGGSGGAASDDATVQVAQTMIRPGSAQTVPLEIVVDINGSLQGLFNLADPIQISSEMGVPLARTEQSVGRLRDRPPADDPGGTPESSRVPLTPSDDTVIAFSLDQTLRRITETILANTSQTTSTTPARLLYIEDFVPKLLDAAGQLLAAATDPPATEQEYASRARAAADRVHHIADTLLAGAGHTTLTDPEGRIVFGNGAFSALMAHAASALSGELDPEAQDRLEAEGQRAWEETLKGEPLGANPVTGPAQFGHHGGEEWDLERTAVKDAVSGQTWAFLNVVRNPKGGRISGSKLRRLSPLVSQLTVLVSLFAYGSAAERESYMDQIEGLAEELGGIIGN